MRKMAAWLRRLFCPNLNECTVHSFKFSDVLLGQIVVHYVLAPVGLVTKLSFKIKKKNCSNLFHTITVDRKNLSPNNT